MENDVLNDLLAEGTTADEQEDQLEIDHTFDLTDDDLEINSEETFEESEETEQGDTDEESETPTNRAFAQMRTQNKEYQNKFEELDSLAKSLGMKDVDDFIAKTKDAQIKRNATEQGIPVEVARELAEMRALKDSIIAEREENAAIEREKSFVANIQEFVNANNLSDSSIDKLSQDLENDGFSVDALMAMPKKALNKLLSSYTDTTYQKNLERKNSIRKELPINQSSKIDTEALNKELDLLAKHLAGKN